MEDRREVALTMEAKRDINWFVKFQPRFNGVTFDQRNIEPDTSVQGLGVRLGFQVYALILPLAYLDLQIAHLEMLNILAALRVWQNQRSNKKVAIACGNQAAVHALNSVRTTDFT